MVEWQAQPRRPCCRPGATSLKELTARLKCPFYSCVSTGRLANSCGNVQPSTVGELALRLEKACRNAIRLPTGDLLERGIDWRSADDRDDSHPEADAHAAWDFAERCGPDKLSPGRLRAEPGPTGRGPSPAAQDPASRAR